MLVCMLCPQLPAMRQFMCNTNGFRAEKCDMISKKVLKSMDNILQYSVTTPMSAGFYPVGEAGGEASPPNTQTSPPNIQASPPFIVACMLAVTYILFDLTKNLEEIGSYIALDCISGNVKFKNFPGEDAPGPPYSAHANTPHSFLPKPKILDRILE